MQETFMRGLGYLTLVLALALGGVGRSADDKAPETPYFPLKVGDSLTYRMGDVRYTRKIAKFEDFEKQPCALMQTLAGDRVASWERVAVKPDGVYRYTTADNEYDPPLCFLKVPVKDVETRQVDTTMAPAGKVASTFKAAEVGEAEARDEKH